MPEYRKITIIRYRVPSKKDLNEEIRWLCSSLGLFSLRDKDSSCYRVFIELLKGTKADTPFSSDSIAKNLGLSRGTVVHHINHLMESGIVVSEKNKYLLRVSNLQSLIDEIEKDVKDASIELRKIAKEIDKELGL